jgi:hypothetical protein
MIQEGRVIGGISRKDKSGVSMLPPYRPSAGAGLIENNEDEGAAWSPVGKDIG